MSQKSHSQADRPNSRAKIKNFTPVLDSVIAEYGYVTALVHGIVWRHCQMSRGVCDKSLDNLAEMLGMSKRTIINHLEILCQAGLIIDTTPDLTHAPHTYTLGKQIEWTISADLEPGEPNNSRSESDSPLGVNQIHSWGERDSPLGVNQIHPKKHHETRKKHHHHEPEAETETQPKHDDDDELQLIYDVLDQMKLDRPGQKAIIKSRKSDLSQLLQDAKVWLEWKNHGGKPPPSYTKTTREGYIVAMLKAGELPPREQNPLSEVQQVAYQQRQAESQSIDDQSNAALSEARQIAYQQRQAESQSIDDQNQVSDIAPIPISSETLELIKTTRLRLKSSGRCGDGQKTKGV